MEEGIEKGKEDVVKHLLSSGAEVAFISKVTGFGQEKDPRNVPRNEECSRRLIRILSGRMKSLGDGLHEPDQIIKDC